MTQFEENYEFECPYCSEVLSIHIDYTGGKRQNFTTDCEVCCKPIAIRLVLGTEGVTDFTADQES